MKVNHAILHILDFESAVNVMSQRELDLDTRAVRSFVTSHLRRARTSGDNKHGAFAENSAFAGELKGFFFGERDFIDLSQQIAEFVSGELAKAEKKLINRNKYQLLVRAGQNLGDITKMITDDVNALKKQKEALLEQQKRETAIKQQKEQVKISDELAQGGIKRNPGISLSDSIEQANNNTVVTVAITDDKTGEVIGHANDEQVTVKIQTPPAKVPEDKIFAYTYRFEGNCKAILTFNKCLKALSKVFKSFKYMEVK